MIPASPPRGKCVDTSATHRDAHAALKARINELLDAGESRVFEPMLAFNATLPTPLATAEVLESIARESAARASASPEGNKLPRREEYVCLDSQTIKNTPESLRAAVAGGETGVSGEKNTEEQEHQDLRGREDDYAPDSNFRRSLATALERRKQSPAWHTPLFALVQVLRGDEDFAPLDDAGAWERFVALLARLVYADGRCGGDPWRDYLGVSADDAEAEFRDLWGRESLPLLLQPARRRCGVPTPSRCRSARRATPAPTSDS